MYIEQKTMIGEYEIQNVLAQGRYSYVYKAIRIPDKYKVAIKCVSKAKHLFLSTYIEQEKKIVSILKKHQNIVLHHGIVEDEKAIYFIMEYVDGYNFSREIAQLYYTKSNMPFEEKREYLLQIIGAVKFLHSQNIYHCDLKPDNILLANDQIKIVDFGCSIISEKSIVEGKRRSINTTPGYGPPEILENEEDVIFLEAVDVWGIGCLIYYFFTGIVPFAAEKYKSYEIHQAVKSLNIDLSILPVNLRLICKSIFVKDFNKRLRIDELEQLIINLEDEC